MSLEPKAVYNMQGNASGTELYQEELQELRSSLGKLPTLQQHIGQTLTITLDRKVLRSASIQSAITGASQLTDNLTLQQAKNIAAILKFGSLSTDFKQVPGH